MTTAQLSPAEAHAPQKRAGTRVWLLVLIAIIAAAVWYSIAYERTPRVVLITSGDGPYWDPVIPGAQDAAK